MKLAFCNAAMRRRFILLTGCFAALTASACASNDGPRPLNDDEIRRLLGDVVIEPVGIAIADHTEIFRKDGTLKVIGRGTFVTRYSVKDGAVHIQTLDPAVVECRTVYRDQSANLYFAACGNPFSVKTAMRFKANPAGR